MFVSCVFCFFFANLQSGERRAAQRYDCGRAPAVRLPLCVYTLGAISQMESLEKLKRHLEKEDSRGGVKREKERGRELSPSVLSRNEINENA